MNSTNNAYNVIMRFCILKEDCWFVFQSIPSMYKYFSFQVTYAGCDTGIFDEPITSTEWKFYRLRSDNRYTIDVLNPYKHFTESSSSIVWKGLSPNDMSIYAVEVIVVLQDFTDTFRIMVQDLWPFDCYKHLPNY